jgi:uncharacterized RDD family membrane protein YckC
MSEENLYAAPQSEILPPAPDGNAPLASPWIRLGSAIIDGIVLLPISFILQKIFYNIPSQEEMMKELQSGKTVEQVVAAATPGFFSQLIVGLLVFAALIAINWVFLKNGQTIGKKLLKTQIQKRSGGLFEVKDLITKRFVPYHLGALVLYAISPFLGVIYLVDALCIFRAGRNTLHDDIAASKVVQLSE